MQPVQPPKKPFYRSPLGIGCGVLVAAFLLCGLIAALTNVAKSTTNTTNTADITATQPTSGQQAAPTQQAVPTQKPVPTHALKWTTVYTFSGNGSKKTGTFTVPDDWRIAWSCQGLTDGSGVDGVLYITVTGTDGAPVDLNAVGANCKYGVRSSDFTEEHQGGAVYLDVNTSLSWTIQVQELK